MPRGFLKNLAITGLVLAGCVSDSPSGIKTDSVFSVGSVRFPNDTVFSRADEGVATNARLQRFLKKCSTRDTVRIGFLGGSITEGAVSSRLDLRYATLLTKFLKDDFPNLKAVVEINAGIGATGSRYGASRLKADILDQAPDLLVVEYAVNDFGAGSDAYIRGTLEGIVRQALLHDSDLPVLLLFTAKGDGQNVQELQKQVGAHYALPMISYRDAIWPLIDSGRFAWSDVFHDDPHPNDNGHRIAAHLLHAYLKKAIGRTGGAGTQVPAPLETSMYQYAGIFAPTDTSVRAELDGWEPVLGTRHGFRSAGADTTTLVLRTRHREMALGIRTKTSGGSTVKIRVDDGPETEIDNGYVFEYTRCVQLFASDTARERTIRIRHVGAATFDIEYVLFAGAP